MTAEMNSEGGTVTEAETETAAVGQENTHEAPTTATRKTTTKAHLHLSEKTTSEETPRSKVARQEKKDTGRTLGKGVKEEEVEGAKRREVRREEEVEGRRSTRQVLASVRVFLSRILSLDL